MKTKEIFNKAIAKAIANDFRGPEGVEGFLKRKKQQYEKLSNEKKKKFDKESLRNPYMDSRILHVAEDKEINKVLVGIDVGPAEVLLAHELEDIDLVISHHPLGKALAHLHEVMELQCDILNQYGVPINVAEGLMEPRISEVARGINKLNHQRSVDIARLLGINLVCLHTACDNLAAKFLKERVEKENGMMRLGELISLLEDIPEYQKAIEIGAGPKIFVGKKQNRCGKVAITEVTGGTEGSSKLYEKMAIAGIGTVIGMHISEEHKKEAEEANINVVIAGHMSSDSLGVNLLMDELEKEGIEIVPCSGFVRVSRGGSK